MMTPWSASSAGECQRCCSDEGGVAVVKAGRLRRLLNWYVPFLFAGVRVETVADDYRYARAALHARWFNRNYVGTHFGGSLYAMTDPFFMIMVMENLGKDYLVWDRRAEVEYVKPGRGKVSVEFRVDESDLRKIREATAEGEKYEHWFGCELRDQGGEVVARVRKQVYVRLKPRNRQGE